MTSVDLGQNSYDENDLWPVSSVLSSGPILCHIIFNKFHEMYLLCYHNSPGARIISFLCKQ